MLTDRLERKKISRCDSKVFGVFGSSRLRFYRVDLPTEVLISLCFMSLSHDGLPSRKDRSVSSLNLDKQTADYETVSFI